MEKNIFKFLQTKWGLFLIALFAISTIWWLVVKQTTIKQPTLSAIPKNEDKIHHTIDEIMTPVTTTNLKEINWPKFNWVQNARQTYHYQLLTETEINPNALIGKIGDWQKIIVDMKGFLNIRLFKKEAEKIYVGFQLSPVELSFVDYETPPLLKELYQTFFLATLTLNGEIIQFYFPKAIPEKDQLMLTNLIHLIQVSVPVKTNSTNFSNQTITWKTKEKDSTGQYEAQYRSETDQIYKQKTTYLTVSAYYGDFVQANTLSLSGHIIDSKFRGTLATKQSWLKTFSGYEKIELKNKQSLIAKVNYNINVKIAENQINHDLAIWQANENPKSVISAFLKMRQQKSVWETKRNQELKEQFASIQLEDIAKKIASLNDKDKPMAELWPHLRKLRDYLSIYPEESAKIPTLLKQKDISNRTSLMLISALQKVGHQEAQKALQTILLETEFTAKQKGQAITAIGELTEPQPELIEALWKIASEPTKNGNTSLLALGSASRHIAETGDIERSVKIIDNLAHSLKAESLPRNQKIILTALANTHDDGIIEIVEPYLSAENKAVRAAANRTLGNFDNPESIDHLVNTLTKDGSEQVRNSSIQALNNHSESHFYALESIKNYLPKEDNDKIRRHIVKYLGKHQEINTDVIEVLQQQLNTETSREVKKEIYKAIYNK